MIALTLCRLIVQAGSLVVAVVTCPAIYYADGGSKAVAALALCMFVGCMVAPNDEEMKKFEAFLKEHANA